MADFDTDWSGQQSTLPAEGNGSISLCTAHIGKALQDSPDGGATLIFSRLNLSEVGANVAEELATIGKTSVEHQSCVKRIALDHNRLTALPAEFPLLTRLRYLNLKHNNLSTFPDVLTLMPSLDTLVMSYNKLKRLPSDPGQLINLRVFSLSRNKIIKLPVYFTRFNSLEVLQVERNPIEWPPKYVIEPTGGLDSSQDMQNWIRTVQRWMELESREKSDDSLGYGGEQLSPVHSTEDSYNSWKSRLQDHSRSYSADSNFSVSSMGDTFQDLPAPAPFTSQAQVLPLNLHFGMLSTSSTEPSPTHSSSDLPSANANSSQDHVTVMPGGNYMQFQDHSQMDSPGACQIVLGRDQSDKKSPDAKAMEISKEKTLDAEGGIPPSAVPYVVGTHADIDDHPGSFGARERDQLPSSVTRSVIMERDAYFRRFSALPAAKAIPRALISLIASIRNILFATCEVFGALVRHMIHITDRKISSVMRKMLDSAGVDILQLINSLDRFDVISQKICPAPAICRGVVETCRDAVAMLNKAFRILGPQLKNATSDDAVLSRWILLTLYGGSTEISCVWQSLAPQIDLIKPLLRTKVFSASTLISNSPTSEPSSTDISISFRPLAVTGGPSVTAGKVRTARRNAGSFSSRDVEIGRNLPSYEEFSGNLGGIVSGMTTQASILRAVRKQMMSPLTMVQGLSPTFPPPHPGLTKPYIQNYLLSNAHSRQGSQASVCTTASDPPELPPNSKNPVEKEALNAIYSAIEIAPVVCDMMEQILDDTLNIGPSVHDTIKQARVVTTKLSDTVQALERTDTPSNAKALGEDAHAFLKIVVKLSGIVKTHTSLHAASSALRTNMIKLTSSTEEFAILLHVSSLGVSTTLPSYTPTFNVSTTFDETYLGSSLSRSKSARELSSQLDGARDPLHPQTVQLRIPHVGLRSRARRRTDITDPG